MRQTPMLKAASGARRRRGGLMLAAAVLLHNLEEAVAYPLFRDEAAALVRPWIGGLTLPGVTAFRISLIVVSLVAAAALAWAGTTQRDRAGWLVLRAAAVILLVNVAVPHVPAAIALGGYAPGVATAVAVNLPIGVWVLALARRA
jgi:hypothetical protein